MSEERPAALYSFAEKSPDIILRLSQSLHILYCNPAAARLSGEPEKPLVGMPASELLRREGGFQIEQKIGELFEHGGDFSLEYVHRHKGAATWYDLQISQEKNLAGEFETILVVGRDITRYKNNKHELQRLNGVPDQTGDAVVTLSEDLTILSWNSAAELIFGLTTAETIGQRITAVLPAGRGGKLSDDLAHLFEALQREVSCTQVFKVYPKADEARWVELRAFLVPVINGSGPVYLLICRDLTDHVRLEQENERQQQLFDSIFTTSPGGMAVLKGQELIIEQMHGSFWNTLRASGAAKPGMRLDENLSVHIRGLDLDTLRAVVRDDANIFFDQVTLEINEEVQTYSLHARPLRWADEKAVLLVAWETTELEQALSVERQRAVKTEKGQQILDALLEYIPEGITIVSAPDLRVTHISKYNIGLSLHARSSSHEGVVRNFGVADSFHLDGITPLKSEELPLARAALNGDVIENEEIVLRRGGENIYLLINAGPIRDGQGNITGAISSIRDITERKRSEMNQKFLGEVSRMLVALRAPSDLMEAITYRLGRFLHADRCFISLIDQDQGFSIIQGDYHLRLPPLEGKEPLSILPARLIDRLKNGKSVIITDVTRDYLTSNLAGEILATQQMLSLIAVPWRDREGKWAGALTVASRSPRVWRPDEIDLVRSVTELARLGLENASLFDNLREFRHRFEVALRNTPISVFSLDQNLYCTWLFHPSSIFQPEVMLNKPLDGLLENGGASSLVRLLEQVLESGQGVHEEIRLPVNGGMVFYDMSVEPLRDIDGRVVGLTCAAMEVTSQRRMEAEAVLNLAHIEVQHRLIQEREQERTRIARELHDGPLQDLIATNFTLVEAMDIFDRDQRMNKMHEIQISLHRQIQELRRFCNDLRPPVLAPFGLGKTIRSHIESVKDNYPGLEITYQLDDDQRALPEDLRMALFHAYKELLNNVVRHSHATEVFVHFAMEDNQVVLEVEDNGIGLDRQPDWLELAREGHLGLVGLRERVEMTNGRVEIESRAGKGTLVRVTVPRPEV